MAYVMVVSLPLILFILIVALAFYLLGRSMGRSQAAAATVPPYYGSPVSAPPYQEPRHKPSETEARA